ncbi:MAG: hypothetical protein IT378_20910 [Sandaracinaceae bacterium]|nr:hypothetical protein [Sandaracinaceae bacterium]
MRGLVEESRGALTWFAQEQREHFAMLLAYEDADAGMVQAMLNGTEQSDPATVQLVFAHEARTERAYVDVMLELMGTRREALNAERAHRGRELIPAPPAECHDASRSGAERIRRMLAWWRASLLDPAQPMLLALVPTALPKPEVYRQIVWGLLPFGALEPWTRNLRLIVRDRRVEPFLDPLLRSTPAEATVGYTVDFSPRACEEGLAADAMNDQLSARERGMAMLQLAALDYAHQRYGPALEKYGTLANLFGELGDQNLVALCLCGAGDVHQRAGQLARARFRYLQAIELAASVQAKPVVLSGLMGLGHATFAMRRYDEAETAWDGAARTAGALGNPYGVADAVEQVGICRAEQRRLHEAILVWERALEQIARTPYGHREVSILTRMVALAEREGWSEHEAQYRARLAVARGHEAEQGVLT